MLDLFYPACIPNKGAPHHRSGVGYHRSPSVLRACKRLGGPDTIMFSKENDIIMKLRAEHFAGPLLAVATLAMGIWVVSAIDANISQPSIAASLSRATNGAFSMQLGDGIRVKLAGRPDRSGRFYLNQSFDGEFAGFEYLDIPSGSLSYDAVGANSPAAFVNGSVVQFESFLVEDDEVLFQTNLVEEERYTFIGSFRSNSRCGFDLDTAGIEGYLVKHRKGNVVGVMKASFQLVWNC
jgi:hypothetical protein